MAWPAARPVWSPGSARAGHALSDCKGTSGTTFDGLLRMVERHRPRAVLMENATGVLWQASAEEETATAAARHGSDAAATMSARNKDHITSVFAQLGYVVAFHKTSAHCCGFPQTRNRVHMLAIQIESESEGKNLLELIDRAFLAVGAVETRPLEQFLLAEAEAAGWSNKKASKAKRARGTENSANWAVVHRDAFQKFNLTWPPQPREPPSLGPRDFRAHAAGVRGLVLPVLANAGD